MRLDHLLSKEKSGAAVPFGVGASPDPRGDGGVRRGCLRLRPLATSSIFNDPVAVGVFFVARRSAGCVP